MRTHSCAVKFDFYVPLNSIRHPFWMLCIRGVHTHVPPPPKSAPKDIKMALEETLSKTDDILTMTARK